MDHTEARTSALTIRRATPTDIPTIQHLSRVIWPVAYGAILSADQIAYMLELMYSSTSLLKQMEEHEFILCHDADEPIGFASFSHVGENVFKLHKIYILPERQGKGVGRFMVEHILRAIQEKGGVALDLNVNRHNPARFFYERLGFEIIREEDIDIGQGYWMNDYVMRKRLR